MWVGSDTIGAIGVTYPSGGKSRQSILGEGRARLLVEIRNWMIQHGIPATGELITFTVRISDTLDDQLSVTVKHSIRERIIRTTLTDEEWSKAFSVVEGKPRQHAFLEFLRSGPNQQRNTNSFYETTVDGKRKIQGGTDTIKKVNRSLKTATLPFRVRSPERLRTWSLVVADLVDPDEA